LARGQLVQETLAKIRLLHRSKQLAVAAVGQTLYIRTATDCPAAAAAAASAALPEVRARSVKAMSVALALVARGLAAAAVDRQVLAAQMTILEEMAATERQVQSQAKASYMLPEEAVVPVSMRAREGHLELAAGAEDGTTTYRQLLGPRTPAAVVAVRMLIKTVPIPMRLAQEQTELW